MITNSVYYIIIPVVIINTVPMITYFLSLRARPRSYNVLSIMSDLDTVCAGLIDKCKTEVSQPYSYCEDMLQLICIGGKLSLLP